MILPHPFSNQVTMAYDAMHAKLQVLNEAPDAATLDRTTEQPVLSPTYAVSGTAPCGSSGALSTAGKTLQVAWYVASKGQFT